MKTKQEVKRDIMRRIMELRIKDMIEEDIILDVLDDNLDTYIDDLLDQEKETRYCIETDYYTYKSETETIIKLLLWDLRNKDYDCVKDIEKAEQFLKGSKE